MPKKTSRKLIPATVRIQRAVKASRNMTIPERAQVMLKAGLLTQEQADKAAELETADKPK
jgi:hypothetical protein